MLLLRVDDPDGRGDPGHVADAAERALELLLLAAHHQQLLLRAARGGDVVEVDLLELAQTLETLGDGGEIGEHPAEPPLVDVGHANALGLLAHGLLRLLLRPDEEDRPAVGDRLLDEVVSAVDVHDRLAQVDDVDGVAFGEDVSLHLRVPAPGLVPEVDAGFEQLAHGYDGHGPSFLGASCTQSVDARRGAAARPGARRDREPFGTDPAAFDAGARILPASAGHPISVADHRRTAPPGRGGFRGGAGCGGLDWRHAA